MNSYDEFDLKVMNSAEDARLHGGSRVEELIRFCKEMGIRKIGIAHCAMFTKEAQQLHEVLSKEFEVVSVVCKIGNIPTKDLLGRDLKGITCNPVGQAEFLEQNNTELNISMGLCMGHDIVFNKKSKVMTTTILVKDRKHNHNPIRNF